MLTISAGNQGGVFVPAPFVEQSIADQLPQGKKPFDAVFIGYRLAVSSWPVGYDSNNTEGKPVWSCAIAANNQADAVSLVRCARQYQYTSTLNRPKFDHATSGVGHVRPQVEVLAYIPELDGLVVVSTPSNFGSVESTLAGFQNLTDKSTGAIGQFPASFRPLSEDKSSKKSGQSWKVHRLEVTSSTNQTSPAWTKYEAWRNGAAQDPAVVATVRQWLAADDRPMTDEVRKALALGAAL